ncbi:hypothetical protein DL765_003544 [Monosporascus sp. GIB2]|nr:hypothetical protein DL765_003544 [Monosporascus sp. GIB2]
MPPDERWERLKDVIYQLYMVDNRCLGKVRTVMQTEYDFTATTSQYEYRFEKWGFQKKVRQKDTRKWQIVRRKAVARRKLGQNISIYHNGAFVAEKNLARRGYTSALESIGLAEELHAQTPPEFEIHTFYTYPAFQHNIPILRFYEMIRQSGSGGAYAIALFRQTIAATHDMQDLAFVDSMLPISSLPHQFPWPCNISAVIEQGASAGLSNLIIYLLSNGLDRAMGEKKIYKSLKKRGSTQLVKFLLNNVNPTAEALIEAIFRLAVEDGDTEMVRLFLKAGLDPNGRICKIADIPDLLRPLQFSCLQGNTEIAKLLIAAGAVIDEPGAGWRSSTLVLAIFGENMWHDHKDWHDDDFSVLSSEDCDVSSDDSSDTFDADLACDANNECQSDDSYALLSLVQSLIAARAKVNLEDLDPYGDHGIWIQEENEYSVEGTPANDLIFGGHTPLTAAAKYRYLEIVELLLGVGSDVDAKTSRGATSLHECLYSWDELKDNVDETQKPLSLFDRGSHFQGSRRITPIFDVVRLLLEAGANPNTAASYEFQYELNSDSEWGDAWSSDSPYYSSSFSPLDLASFIPQEKLRLTELLLTYGVRPTESSLEIACTAGNYDAYYALLAAGCVVSEQAIQEVVKKWRGSPTSPRGFCWSAPVAVRDTKWLDRVMEIRRDDPQTIERLWIEATKCGLVDVLILVRSRVNMLLPSISALSKLTGAIEFLCSKKCDNDTFNGVYRLNIGDRSPKRLLGASVWAATQGGNFQLALTLIELGADVNAVSGDGNTALMAAVRRRSLDYVRLLIKARASTETGGRWCAIHRGQPRGDILLTAILKGDFLVINELIEGGANLHVIGDGSEDNSYYCKCVTPLTQAILGGHFSLVPYLIDLGCGVNNPSNLTRTITPLAAAVKRRKLDLIRTLIQKGANIPDVVAEQEAEDWGEPEVFDLLGVSIADREYVDDSGRSALRMAIQRRNLMEIKFQLDQQRVDINRIQGDGQTFLSYALEIYEPLLRFEIMALLLQAGADPRGVACHHGSQSKNAILLAIERKYSTDIVELLLDYAKDGSNVPALAHNEDFEHAPVQLATKTGRLDIVQALLRRHWDTNTVPPESKDPPALHLAADKGSLEMVSILLQHGALPNPAAGGTRCTPLQAASRRGHLQIVEELINHGADVNSSPYRFRGATALQYAAMSGFLGVAELLLKHGAEVDAPSAKFEGRTALEGAAEHGRLDMVQFLLNAGAKVTGEGGEQYCQAIKRAADNGHFAIRRLLESYFRNSL